MEFTTTAAPELISANPMSLSTPEAILYSVLGICVVFFALILLMVMIKIMVKVIPAEKQKEEAAPVAAAPVPKEKAPGSAGEIALNGVEPRVAAMCMAIVADELKKPVNELRFISIKEIKE